MPFIVRKMLQQKQKKKYDGKMNKNTATKREKEIEKKIKG